MIWQTSRRQLSLERTLVMAILNVTPDSFSDGGKFNDHEAAISQAKLYVEQGAGILDIGGESTRPGSRAVSAAEEIERVVPVIRTIAGRIDIPISVDTSKSDVARAAIEAGAEIVNDISGLRFDPAIAKVAAETGCGLVLMHSRGTFETLHTEPPVDDILCNVIDGLHASLGVAVDTGVDHGQIVIDPGIGFGKTLDQNLELLANIDKLRHEFQRFPIVVGASRKSFIGKILGGSLADERTSGSLAAAVIAAFGGVNILRVHDVPETVEALKMTDAIIHAGKRNLH